MNLRRNRRRKLWLALGAALILITTGFLREEVRCGAGRQGITPKTPMWLRTMIPSQGGS